MTNFMHPKPEQWERKTKRISLQVPRMGADDFEAWLRKVSADWDTIDVSGYISGERMETDEEFETRKAGMRESEARHRKFVKERYAEIMEDEK